VRHVGHVLFLSPGYGKAVEKTWHGGSDAKAKRRNWPKMEVPLAAELPRASDFICSYGAIAIWVV
jgi:hypothetical protein